MASSFPSSPASKPAPLPSHALVDYFEDKDFSSFTAPPTQEESRFPSPTLPFAHERSPTPSLLFAPSPKPSSFFLENPPIFKPKGCGILCELTIVDGWVVSSRVGGVEVVFGATKLGEIRKIPVEGLEEYVSETDEGCFLTKKFTRERVKKVPREVLKGEMIPAHKLLFEIVNKDVLPRDGRNALEFG
ncbi:hypothetical protein CQW23_26130 [Capsicum baccatum]|uniref:Uncharacterized protein n=1 Tax=Capsicum baccatum TaxID=33114 RepID=A0A2G2VMX5_CAPBA|nr:hypothetical protein CQW23_26130 [Capsicum baccatum]